MRFTKFFAAAMAAMTIVSCSEQVEDFGTNVQPGDAVLSFRVGTNEGTTYATEVEEKKVNSLTAYLAYKDMGDGDVFTEITGKESLITTTLAKGTYQAGPATLYIVANMPSATGVLSEEELNKMIDNKEIYSIIKDKPLSLDNTGMTATRKVNIELTPGTVDSGTFDGGTATSGKVTLKRLAARVFAESSTGNGTDIQGYKVTFNNIKKEANLFSYEGTGLNADNLTPYEIIGDGSSQYGSKEAVGYVYPSSTDIVLTVTNKSGVSKEVFFAPIANKNYKLLITPDMQGTTPSFTVTIADYDEVTPGLDVDFTPATKVSANAVMPSADFSVGNNGELVINNPVGATDAGVLITFANLFAGTPEADLQLALVTSVSRALTDEYRISADKKFAFGDSDVSGLSFIALPNYGVDKSYTATFTAQMGDVESTRKPYSINLVVKGMNLPADFTTKVGELEFMSVGYQGSLESTIAYMDNIKGFKGLTFADKAIAYLQTRTDENDKSFAGMGLRGPEVLEQRDTVCPAGFVLPTGKQMVDLLAMPLGEELGAHNVHALVEGKNTLGNVTAWYNSTSVTPYATLQDGGEELVVLEKTNFVTSTAVKNSAQVDVTSRLILWNGNVTYEASSSAVRADCFIRCVKLPETLLTSN